MSPSRREQVYNNLDQLREALGDDNRWFAGLCLGHCPIQDEAVDYYWAHGGPEGHRQRMETMQFMPLDLPTDEEQLFDELDKIKEALGDDNRWFAGLCLGHRPTDEEAIEYYRTHGGPEGHQWRKEAKKRRPVDQAPSAS
jgi:hypothetical protein